MEFVGISETDFWDGKHVIKHQTDHLKNENTFYLLEADMQTVKVRKKSCDFFSSLTCGAEKSLL